MKNFAQLLSIEQVVLDWDAANKKRLFEQIGLFFENQAHLSRTQVYDALFEREKLGSTGLGMGFALPHGRIKGLKEPLLLFVRLLSAIPFESPDGELVSLILVLLVPANATEEHLNLLSEIASRFSQETFRDQLLKCVTEQEAFDLLIKEPVYV